MLKHYELFIYSGAPISEIRLTFVPGGYIGEPSVFCKRYDCHPSSCMSSILPNTNNGVSSKIS